MSHSSQTAAVVGAGAFGLAAAVELRSRGWAVTLLDPGPLPRPQASSTDRSKVARMDYGSDEALSRLAQLALDRWERWNVERFPHPLFHRTGFLWLTLEPMATGGLEMESFHDLAARGIPVERVNPDVLAERFPAWNPARFVDGYLSHQAGWAESGEVVQAMLAWCLHEGVTLLHRRAERVLYTGGSVEGVACAGGEMVSGDALIVASGAWTPRLLPELAASLRPAAMPVLFFRPRNREPFFAHRFPVWGADIARTGWYGFPVGLDGIVKLGHHGKGWTGDPEDPCALPRLGGPGPDLPGQEHSGVGRRPPRRRAGMLLLRCERWALLARQTPRRAGSGGGQRGQRARFQVRPRTRRARRELRRG